GVQFPPASIDYGSVIPFKVGILARAWERFLAGKALALRQHFEEFGVRQASWLDDFALFMALKDAHGGANWQTWPPELVLREPAALANARAQLAGGIGLHRFQQFLFFRQWAAVKRYANGRGVRLIGDLPIFVAADSADVWANAELFQLDDQRHPRVVAGVPPDYFSATGQLWGN